MYKWQEIELVYYIAPDGVELPLFNGKRTLMSFNGLGMPEINYISDSSPFTNGIRVRDYRVKERIIDFILRENSCSRQARWDNVGEIVDRIRMNRGGVGKILVVLPDGTQREIDAWIQEGPAAQYDAMGDLSAFDLSEPLRFLAPYPIWRDPLVNQENYTITPAESCLDNCLPFCLGSGTNYSGYIYSEIEFTYPGTFDSFPTFELVGPLDFPTIAHQETGKQIELQYNISSGERVTIALSPDRAEVTNNFGADLIGTVSSLNDLGSFSIVPEGLDVPDGVNTILVTGVNAALGTTSAIMYYNDNYLAVPR